MSCRTEFHMTGQAGTNQQVRSGHELHGFRHGVCKVMDTRTIGLRENDVMWVAFSLKENEDRLFAVGSDYVF